MKIKIVSTKKWWKFWQPARDQIYLTEAPTEDRLAAIWVRSPKLETETNIGEASCDMHAGKQYYDLPDGITRKDITGMWLFDGKNRHYFTI